ncbi:MAG: hypothetical protein AB8G05_21710 [Oligoflexales bacterium]
MAFNRNVTSNKLIIGCGNLIDLPLYERFFDEKIDSHFPPHIEQGFNPDYIEASLKYALRHRHEGFDTLDLNALMNPTVVGQLGGRHTLAGSIFPEHKYEVIYFEGSFPPVDDLLKIENEFDKMLSSSGRVEYVCEREGKWIKNKVLYEARKGWTEEGLAMIEKEKERIERLNSWIP